MISVLAASPPPRLGTITGEVTSTLTGKVVDSITRKPIRFAIILVLGAQTGAQTNDSGRFEIIKIQPGEYAVRVRMAGYVPLERQVRLDPGEQSLGTIRLVPVVPPEPVVGTSAVSGGELRCEVALTNPAPTVGDQIHLSAQIHNDGSKDVVLPYGLDGSDGNRYPKIRVRVEGPDGGCGAFDQLEESDLATVAPGGTIDVLAKWVPSNIRSGRIAKPGSYKVIVNYSTKERDARQWVGSMDATIPGSLLKRLRRVPMVNLTDSVRFEVRTKRPAKTKA